MSKRKARSAKHKSNAKEFTQSQPYEPDHSLFIQAHEADIVRGPQAHASSLALEVNTVDGRIIPGDGLIQWKNAPDAPSDVEGQDSSDEKAIWVDRYDARLLLDALSLSPPVSQRDRLSPTGWSDLPSDTEDTFFLSPEEIEDYNRERRRRMIERGREERLRALREEQDESQTPKRPEDDWGGSDEEPDEKQKELMRRTAAHILSSPTPAQLEMRILANHGADARFAFLRGRWSRAWKITKGRARLQIEAQKKEQEDKEKQKQKVGLGGLAGYGESDEDSDDVADRPDDEQRTAQTQNTVAEKPLDQAATVSDDAAKEARRARAREWAEKRRAALAQDTPSRDSLGTA